MLEPEFTLTLTSQELEELDLPAEMFAHATEHDIRQLKQGLTLDRLSNQITKKDPKFKDNCLAYLAAGGSINTANTSDWTLLETALLSSTPDVVEFLLNKKANLNRPHPPLYFQTPLMIAAQSNKDPAPVIDLLVRHKADPNFQDPFKQLLFTTVASFNHITKKEQTSSALEALIRNGADTKQALASANINQATKDAIHAIVQKLEKEKLDSAKGEKKRP